MNSLIVREGNFKYLVRYQVLKSVVNRKHTTKQGKVTNRLELHANSVVVYLYGINSSINLDTLINANLKSIKTYYKDHLTYLGKGLSKCSDKDKFDKNIGITRAIINIENLDKNLAGVISHIILDTKL